MFGARTCEVSADRAWLQSDGAAQRRPALYRPLSLGGRTFTWDARRRCCRDSAPVLLGAPASAGGSQSRARCASAGSTAGWQPTFPRHRRSEHASHSHDPGDDGLRRDAGRRSQRQVLDAAHRHRDPSPWGRERGPGAWSSSQKSRARCRSRPPGHRTTAAAQRARAARPPHSSSSLPRRSGA